MAREQNNPCYILRAGYWGVAKLVPARSAGLGKFNRQSCCKDALRELYQGFLVDEDFGEAMGIDFFNGRGVGFGFGIGCGFGIGWGFGGTPLQTLGLGAGGGCGVGLGLGWGFGSAYGTRYLDSKLKFQGTDFGKVKTAAASQQPLNSPQKYS